MASKRAMKPLFIALGLVLSACGTIATPIWQAPTRTATAVAQVSTVSPTAIPPTAASAASTATPLPPTVTDTPLPATATAAPTEVVAAGIDANVIGDPEHGQALFNTFQPDAGYMCATCHWADREDRLIGPGLVNISARAASRVEGQNAVQYIYNSIVNPGAYVVEGFPDGLMPRNWAQIYTQEDINDIIAYLLTLR